MDPAHNSIRLDLSRHCIETEIRRRHNRCISAYFKAGSQSERRRLETTLELLESALQRFDFAGLRSRHAALCGGTQSHILLHADRQGEPGLTIDGVSVNPRPA